MGDVEGDELEAVRSILVEVQLGQFFTRVRDDLQVSVWQGYSRLWLMLDVVVADVIYQYMVYRDESKIAGHIRKKNSNSIYIALCKKDVSKLSCATFVVVKTSVFESILNIKVYLPFIVGTIFTPEISP